MVSRLTLVSDGQDQNHIAGFIVFIKRDISCFATGDDEFAKVVLHQAAYFRVLFQNGQCIQYQIDGFNRVFSLMGAHLGYRAIPDSLRQQLVAKDRIAKAVGMILQKLPA